MMTRLKAVARDACGGGVDAVVSAVVAAAEHELEADVASNKAIGQHGADAILKRTGGKPARVLTHCNTGTLATAGYGTALGVIRALHARGMLAAVYCTETRPYNQGARLTAYELVVDGLQPATLICDSAAAALMASGAIDAVVVGADRVAANGDTANKVGTYALAVAAKHHGVTFLVAAPRTTLDPGTAHGGAIHIEQRPAEEVTHSRSDGARMAPEGIAVWNPCFDITPAKLISGIVTELDVLLPQTSEDGVVAFNVTEHVRSGSTAGGAPRQQPLDTATVLDYVASQPALAARLGGISTRATWSAREVGDGNINFIFVVTGAVPAFSLVVKQALPYIRLVGERWPLTQERIGFEVKAMRTQHLHCPQHVPEVFSWDESLSLIAMRYIEPPHVMLRSALASGRCFPYLQLSIGRFLAPTLFLSSHLALTGTAFRRAMHDFGCNADMCALTERVIFTDPYDPGCTDNRHTSPQLDADAAALLADEDAKDAAARLKHRFLTCSEALLHGDLHTGSCMVADDSTFVFDAEFAFYGPMGFDIGLFLGNLLLAYFAADAHGAERKEKREWLLTCVEQSWSIFMLEFGVLWRGAGGASDAFINAYMERVWVDTVGFAGAEMIRRIVGIAHVEDFERLTDADTRARCERKALQCGRRMLVDTAHFRDVDVLCALACEL